MAILFLRRSSQRGHTKLDWLNSRHSFSFGDYYDPAHIGFGSLLVLNEDFIQPGKGFGLHPHKDMEIITIMLQGTLEHQDNMGNRGLLLPGEVQHMSAGRGVIHAEYNHSQQETVHLLQIWIRPKEAGIKPSYEQLKYNLPKNMLVTIAAGTKNKKHLYLHQQAKISRGIFESNKSVAHSPKHRTYLFLITGKIILDGYELQSGDAAGIIGDYAIQTKKESDVLFIDVF